MAKENLPTDWLSSSPDWQALLSHFELTSGFAFIVLLVPSERVAADCRETLAAFLSERGRTLTAIAIDSPSQLADLPGTLLAEETRRSQAGAADAIWVERFVAEDAGDYAAWRNAWREAVLKLNQFRNPLVRSFDASLLFVGAPWLKEAIREEAPDLWSIRSMVAEVNRGSGRARPAKFETDLAELESVPALDPRLALQKAAEIAEVPGSEEMQATLFLRAAVAFSQRREFRLCSESLQKFLNISKQVALPLNLLAEVYCLQGHLAAGRGDIENAKESFARSLAMSPDATDVAARSCYGLGNIAQMQGDFGAAHKHFLKSLAISETRGDPRLAALSYNGLGETDRDSGNLAAARDWYLKSVAAWESLGESHLAARPYRGLGMIALELSDFSAARQWFLKSLAIFEKTANIHNTATICDDLGNLEANRGDMEASAKWLVRSIGEFRKAAEPEAADQVAKSFQSLYFEASPKDREKMLALWRDAHLPPSITETLVKQ